jgi:hypothetical protein
MKPMPAQVFRAFDCDHTLKLEDEIYNKLKQNFIEMFISHLHYEKQCLWIMQWYKQVAEVGCEKLFDKIENQACVIKPKILSELGWDAFTDPLLLQALLCGFINSFAQRIMKEAEVLDVLFAQYKTSAKVIAHGSEHYREWACQTMQALGYCQPLSKLDKLIKSVITLPKQNPATTAVAFGSLGLLAGMGITLFYSLADASKAFNQSMDENKYAGPTFKY